MRRSSFYPFSHLPRTFYADTAYHRPRRPSNSPSPTPPSVINIPVFESAALSWPPSSPPQPHPVDPHRSSPPALNSPSVSLIDPSSAATIIQSHFRGFCVRRHRPLLHLCSIAKARKQLEDLQSELKSPGFPLKLKTSEKERLRFSESVMAIILRLDAIEGSLPEVRSQRKVATKVAIKLQDAVDAIMMQKDEIVDLNLADSPHSEGSTDDSDVLCEQSEEQLSPDVNTEEDTVSEEGIMDVKAMEADFTPPEVDVSDKHTSSVDNDMEMLDDNVSTLGAEHIDKRRGPGVTGCFESVAQVKAVETMYDTEEHNSSVTGENTGTHIAEEEVNNGIDALHSESQEEHMQENVVVAATDHDVSVHDVIVASSDCAQAGASDGSCTGMDVVKEAEGGLNQEIEICPGTSIVKEEFNYPHFSNVEHQSQLHGASTALETQTDNCSSGRRGIVQHQQVCKVRCDGAHENGSNEGNSCDKLNATSSSPSEVEAQLLPDSSLRHQLSEDCRQLKSLVGKLLLQNKAQSKVLCTLGERLQLIEHQQLVDRQRNRKKMLKKMKSKKGPKRSIKFCNFE